ncbi:MAG: hypothetical protein K2J80_02870 [Oscillospiraceae bacterium]|nr:hypothetical protein [Oscillospiraceae bacterium]
MEFVFNLIFVICGISALTSIVRTVRMFAMAKRARILKVCVSPHIIITLGLFAGLLTMGIIRLSEANEQLRQAEAYERMLASNPASDGFQHAAIKTNAPLSAADVQQITENIKILNENYDALMYWVRGSFAFAIFELAYTPGSLLIFTEEGVLQHGLNFPEPIAAEINGDKINVSYKTGKLANFKRIGSFKATPKNMAVFGRFIEWEDPNTVNVPQNVQPPNNMFS